MNILIHITTLHFLLFFCCALTTGIVAYRCRILLGAFCETVAVVVVQSAPTAAAGYRSRFRIARQCRSVGLPVSVFTLMRLEREERVVPVWSIPARPGRTNILHITLIGNVQDMIIVLTMVLLVMSLQGLEPCREIFLF